MVKLVDSLESSVIVKSRVASGVHSCFLLLLLLQRRKPVGGGRGRGGGWNEWQNVGGEREIVPKKGAIAARVVMPIDPRT